MAILLVFTISLFTVSAQESVNTNGGNISGSSGSVSYSVGQVTYQNHSGTNGSVAEGVQHPFEISVITSIEEANGISLSVSAYPNPTTDYLTLQIIEISMVNLSYQLYNMQGKLLRSENITDTQTNIVMSDLVPSIYFVKVIQKGNEIKTFKIIKH